MRRLPLLLALVTAVLPAGAACFDKTFGQLTHDLGYFYVRFPAAAATDATSVVGRFWTPGQRSTASEGTCTESSWLVSCPGCSPGAPGEVYYLDGDLGAACALGCPSAELVTLVETKSVDGTNAWFAAARVTENPSRFYDFDYARVLRDLDLVEIPRPEVLSSGSGPLFPVTIRFRDPADGFFGLSGVPASGTITAFLLYEDATPPSSRLASAWPQVNRFPYTGGVTQGTHWATCPPAGVGTTLAAALEFGNGEVATTYVSRSVFVECDPAVGGAAGRIPEDPANGLRLTKETNDEITLRWGPSCVTSDQDYAIYEGTIGDFANRVPNTCTTAGALSRRFVPLSGSVYYLVVPQNTADDREGSYGRRSDGSERPPSGSACSPQAIATCPE